MASEAGTLVFWKPSRAIRRQPPAPKVSEALRRGGEPEHLEDLPVGKILRALGEQYPGLERTGDGFAEVDIDEEQTGVEFAWNRKHFRCDFYGDAFRRMESTTALMARFGCSCYWEEEKKLYPPGKPPKFYDPEFDAHMDKVFDALGKRAMSGDDPDPLVRLKRAVDFMKSGELEKQVGKPPGGKRPQGGKG